MDLAGTKQWIWDQLLGYFAFGWVKYGINRKIWSSTPSIVSLINQNLFSTCNAPQNLLSSIRSIPARFRDCDGRNLHLFALLSISSHGLLDLVADSPLNGEPDLDLFSSIPA